MRVSTYKRHLQSREDFRRHDLRKRFKALLQACMVVEEVENQIEVSMMAEQLECEVEEVRDMVRAEKEGNDFCIGTIHREDFNTFETYQCTDATWCAVVSREWIVDQLEELRDSDED